jgi:hypothetical protein
MGKGKEELRMLEWKKQEASSTAPSFFGLVKHTWSRDLYTLLI